MDSRAISAPHNLLPLQTFSEGGDRSPNDWCSERVGWRRHLPLAIPMPVLPMPVLGGLASAIPAPKEGNARKERGHQGAGNRCCLPAHNKPLVHMPVLGGLAPAHRGGF